MPPPLPPRYRLEVRLGRDADVEEWFAHDENLDRPVLVRVLGPDATPERRATFLRAVRGASTVTHPHLAAVFEAAEVPDGAYAVMEWTGGVTIADRIRAGQTIPADEFLPNAAGLADALAALHRSGIVHGGIDTAAISYSGGHPAKLGAFGRPGSDEATPTDDVRSLAAALEEGLVGAPSASPLSQVVDGIAPTVDVAIAAAKAGELTAAELALALRAAPSPPPPPPPPRAFSWRWTVPALVLLLVAGGLLALGRLVSGGSATTIPTVPTSGPPATSAPSDGAPPTTVATTLAGGEVRIVSARAYDPFGSGGEHDDDVVRVLDGDPATRWRTESYFDPLPLIKPGVGLLFEVAGTPSTLEVIAIAPGTAYEIHWAPPEADPAQGLGAFERVASGRATTDRVVVQLPPREGGWWLLWLVDLPIQDDGDHQTAIGEVRFLP